MRVIPFSAAAGRYCVSLLGDASMALTQRILARNPGKGYILALVAGAVAVVLDFVCPYFSRYGPVPFGIPFVAWVVLLFLVAWYDDAILRGWVSWWFVAILDLYVGVYAGWHAIDPPVRFRTDGFISGLVVGVLPVFVLYVLARWVILGLTQQVPTLPSP